MATNERTKRLCEILDRKDAMAIERVEINGKLAALAEEQAVLDAEVQELLGVPAEETHSRAPQKCSVCGEIGHSKRTCTKKGGE